MKKLIDLGRENAKELVKKEKRVYWRSGVWNSYVMRTDIEAVLKDIDDAGFGVDVFEQEGILYVSRPSNGDMF